MLPQFGHGDGCPACVMNGRPLRAHEAKLDHSAGITRLDDISDDGLEGILSSIRDSQPHRSCVQSTTVTILWLK